MTIIINYTISVVQETIKPSAVEIKRIIVRILSGDAILQFFKLAIMQHEDNWKNMMMTFCLLKKFWFNELKVTFIQTSIYSDVNYISSILTLQTQFYYRQQLVRENMSSCSSGI